MDTEHETGRLKWMLFFVFILLVSGFFTIRELNYSMKAEMVDGRVERTESYRTVGRRSRERTRVYYNFTDKQGVAHSDSDDDLSAGWEPPASGIVKIQYVPGDEEMSRLAENTNYFMVVLFIGSLGAVGYYGYKFWREVREATKTPASSYRRK
jgi:hypothetical protein